MIFLFKCLEGWDEVILRKALSIHAPMGKYPVTNQAFADTTRSSIYDVHHVLRQGGLKSDCSL